MARKKADGEPAAEAPTGTEKVTKANAVRAALAEGADTPTEGIAFIKARFGIDITPQHFSSYKSSERAKAGKPAGRRGRKPRATRSEPTAAPRATPSNGSIGVAGSVQTIKALVASLGVDQVKEIAEIFRK
jgi:hypothetical protein